MRAEAGERMQGWEKAREAEQRSSGEGFILYFLKAGIYGTRGLCHLKLPLVFPRKGTIDLFFLYAKRPLSVSCGKGAFLVLR